uniref:Uncharacterized protein n=1 Tax=Lotharella globosa TaxID=91324 RepID=A0A7S3ZA80_9EUKA|mmetsp:Transcript_2965/g.5626  ORF Transcript_2965/g.5626 Transcript_2965/m.5626 type:complete len:175 (+) Transcript_2965:188-712(+)|eukprot:CAMPEP_0167772602 /NCGR_PEP_ID=MMETSP0111_2-20121227/937_1 /TAXON_ID=91324 /ORGANISM="Lotharella globosa, Strain CCCM811" /LENGTH=174 /DNA_ID=CAMNT_0007662109 /DNA_START=126 /DNA_END=650 /DNA_ORIENTATION=+
MAHAHTASPAKAPLKPKHRFRRNRSEKNPFGSQELIIGSPAIRDSPLSLELGLVRKINTFGCSAPLKKSLRIAPKRKLSRSYVREGMSLESVSSKSSKSSNSSRGFYPKKSCWSSPKRTSCLSPLADRPMNSLCANAKRNMRSGTTSDSKQSLNPESSTTTTNVNNDVQFRLEL